MEFGDGQGMYGAVSRSMELSLIMGSSISRWSSTTGRQQMGLHGMGME